MIRAETNLSKQKRRKALYLLATTSVLVSGTTAIAEETLLAPIYVEGNAEVVTEGSDSYRSDRVTVGGKQPQDIRDVPQTVVVLPRDVLDDSNSNSIEEAARLIPSLTAATGDGFVGSLYTRGQEVFQYFVDGAPRPFLSIYGTAPDLFFFDRFEVMSGPSGVFQGSGEPVGTLNLVRKRPTEERQYIVGASGDSEGSYRFQVDVGGDLNEAGTVRARVAAYTEQRESFVDYAERDARGLYGTLEVDLGDATTLSFGTIKEESDTVRFSGLPTYLDGSLITDDVEREFFLGSDENNADIDTREFFAELEYEFDYGGVLKFMGRYYENDASLRNFLAFTEVDEAIGDFEAGWFAREYEQEALYTDLNLTSPLDVGGIPIELVVGADYRRVEQTTLQNFADLGTSANINDFNPKDFDLPDIEFPGVGPGFRLNTKNTTNEIGLYAQARIEATDRLKFNIGGRYSIYDARNEDTGRGTVEEDDQTDFAPYIGATFDLTETWTAYASYAQIFQPQTEFLDANGNVLKPRQGEQAEIGVKYVTLDGRFSGQASAFWIRDKNRALEDGPDLGTFTASDEAETTGFDLLLTGEVLPNFDIIGGVSIVDTDLENDPTPEENFSLYGRYSFDQGSFDGFAFGGGVRVVGDFDVVTTTQVTKEEVTIKADGYTVFDAFASYAFNENVDLRLNVTNLFDNTYVERIGQSTRATFFGQPRTATLSLNARF